MTVQYRLTWQSVDSHYAAEMEAQHGPAVWEHMSDEDWSKLPWQPPTQRIGGSDIFDQRRTLELWAKYHHQPIANVSFERRELPDDDWGWEPVPAQDDTQGRP